MPTRTAVAALVVLALLAGSSRAVQAGGQTLDMPGEPGGWVLEIRTRGGIMGQGVGDIAIASNGRLLCLWQSARCGRAVAGETLRAVVDQVRRASVVTWTLLPPTTTCMDCVTTHLVLTSRNADGTLTTLRASWDPTTRAQLPGDVTRLHDMTVSLRR